MKYTAKVKATMESNNVSNGNKRARTSGMYQRRRAVTACLPCRVRKTKCDNIRPTCGFCTRHNAQCSYTDTANDHSSFDPASLAILDRINHVVELLENQSSKSLGYNVSCNNHKTSESNAPYSSSLYEDRNLHHPDAMDETSLNTPGFPAFTNNCEGILKWPVFQDLAPSVRSFLFGTEGQEHQISRGLASSGRGIQEEDFIPLSKRFLSYVHIKNPVLDVPDFIRHVREAATNGLGWDGQSCLTLLACALGSVAVPFDSTDNLETSPFTAATGAVSKETGATYYVAAMKRLGLIEPSWLRVQCLFLSGVFEMYSLRPLNAWNYFNQACGQLQNLFWIHDLACLDRDENNSWESRRLEQRLYWSCMKSEFELRCEIPLPPSGIGRLNFSGVLPLPPADLLLSPSQDGRADDACRTNVVDHDEERSWFYYLAEISFRQIMNRAFVAIGSKGETSWITNFQQVRAQHDLFREQIEHWCSHIPPQINFEHEESCSHELAYLIRARAMIFREWIHRPFLYYVIHQPLEDPFMEQAMPLARSCLELCVESQFMIKPFHLHHGAWYVARNSMARALLLIAAARCGKIEMPNNWREALDHALQTLRYWSSDALDLRQATNVLQDLMNGL